MPFFYCRHEGEYSDHREYWYTHEREMDGDEIRALLREALPIAKAATEAAVEARAKAADERFPEHLSLKPKSAIDGLYWPRDIPDGWNDKSPVYAAISKWDDEFPIPESREVLMRQAGFTQLRATCNFDIGISYGGIEPLESEIENMTWSGDDE